MDTQFAAGDRVGIMDEADYRHWSRFGAVVDGPGDVAVPSGTFAMYHVLEDGHANAIPVSADKLFKLGPPDAAGVPGEWSAQCFPVDGDRPGLPMYFRNGAEAWAFVGQFLAATLSDERLHVHAPAGATEDERRRMKNAGVELV